DSHLIHRDEIEPVDDDSYSGIGDFAAGIFSREDGLLFFYNQRVVNDTLLVEQEKGSNQQQHLLEVDESFVAESWYGSPLDHHGEIGVDVPADDVAEPSDVAHPIIYDGTERDEDVPGDAYQNNENEELSSKKLRLEEDKEESLEKLFPLGNLYDLPKIVSRILRMPEISQEQLRWCEKKMTKVRIWDGKVQRDSSPFPFPVH
ncbi:hypothetical protein GW17_00022542, partial [Ensete ventricosum]